MFYKLFGVADYEFDIRFIKFKMANPKWRTYFEKKSYCNEKLYKKVFGISNHEFLLLLEL
jgi:hypothetical protein